MKKFCDKCLKEVECTYNEKYIDISIDNNKINYLKKYYICSECNNEFLDDLYDYDVEIVNKKLRELNNIITIDEIEEIIRKYNIGKKPLSLLLGLGEVNIIRYLNGANPTKEISDLLKNILNNPFLYELYLRANKDKITEIAYKKSLGKTKQLELNSKQSKLYNVSLYIINKLEEVDPLSIQKLLYFADGFSNKFLGKDLFSDLPEAWIYGPVYKEIYDCFSYYKGNTINYNELLSNREYNLEDEEIEYLNNIIKTFGCYSGSLLREMTHITNPWINARIGLNEYEYSDRVISKEDINLYFDKICQEYNITCQDDIINYSNDLFIQSKDNLFRDNN